MASAHDPQTPFLWRHQAAVIVATTLVVLGAVVSIYARISSGTGPTTDVDAVTLGVLIAIALPGATLSYLTRRWQIWIPVWIPVCALSVAGLGRLHRASRRPLVRRLRIRSLCPAEHRGAPVASRRPRTGVPQHATKALQLSRSGQIFSCKTGLFAVTQMRLSDMSRLSPIGFVLGNACSIMHKARARARVSATAESLTRTAPLCLRSDVAV